MFLHGWIAVRFMVASVIDMVLSWMWWRRYDDVGRRVRRMVRIWGRRRRRVMFGRTRVGIRRLILSSRRRRRRRGGMVRQLTGRR